MKFLRLFVVVLFLTLVSDSLYAEKTVLAKVGDASNREQENKTAQKETYDAHRSYTRYHFKNDEMDFAFQWLLGSIPNGGAEDVNELDKSNKSKRRQ